MASNSIVPQRLTGEALGREFEKQLEKLEPGCTLTITSEGLAMLGDYVVRPPVYPHRRVFDEQNNKLVVTRLVEIPR